MFANEFDVSNNFFQFYHCANSFPFGTFSVNGKPRFMCNISSDFLKLRFEHNNRVLFITIYSEVIIQLYVADFHQTKLKDKEAASSLESFS